MKNDRRNKILQIIQREPVETQEQLLEHLAKQGVRSTQATISRDIKSLRLVKEPNGDGRYRYAVSRQKTNLSHADRLQAIFRDSVTHMDSAQNLVVLKTMPGLASAACAALDGMEIEELVGTLAGDDTALLVMRDTEAAEDFCQEIKMMLN